ncbi:hypothetical protein D3C79_569480 [compost metagenome]
MSTHLLVNFRVTSTKLSLTTQLTTQAKIFVNLLNSRFDNLSDCLSVLLTVTHADDTFVVEAPRESLTTPLSFTHGEDVVNPHIKEVATRTLCQSRESVTILTQ